MALMATRNSVLIQTIFCLLVEFLNVILQHLIQKSWYLQTILWPNSFSRSMERAKRFWRHNDVIDSWSNYGFF